MEYITPFLAVTLTIMAVNGMVAQWRMLTKNVDKGLLIVTRSGSDKSVTLPASYCHSAVTALTDLLREEAGVRWSDYAGQFRALF